WGCFVGPGPKWFVLSHGDTVEVRGLVRDQVLSTVQIPGGGYAARAIGPAKIAIALAGGGIGIYALPHMDLLAKCEFPGKVLEMRADIAGKHLVALGERGDVSIYDEDGKALATSQFTFPERVEVIHPSVDISPNGKTVLFQAGRTLGAFEIWQWESNKRQT